MHEHAVELNALAWAAGWLLAVLILFIVGARLPLATGLGGIASRLYAVGCVAAGLGVWVLANVALHLNDTHIDLTREKVYTPSATAMAVVDELRTPVNITYFYRSEDPIGQRARNIMEVMGRRNPMLTVLTVDPDKQPELARREGVRLYNAAIVEAAGRRVLIQGTDEAEIAIGIQRALRTRSLTVCFLEGHGEFAMDGFEFHTHLEGISDHSHGDASSQIIETAGHGVGRLRRVLEAQGYATAKLLLATTGAVPGDCTVVLVANPRTTFLPAESAALRTYLAAGGSALFMLDLGFVPEAGLSRLLSDLGARLEQEVVVDPLSHYQRDAEMVAVTGYDPHPITRTLSLTFFPGIRPLTLTRPVPGVEVTPILQSSRDSYARPVLPADARTVESSSAPAAQVAEVRPRVLGIAAEGTLAPGASPFRAVVIGDGDFASNSFLPYMSNSDLLVAAVRWLAREERGTAVRTRIPVPPMVLLTAAQSRWLFALIVIVLPLTVIGIGGAVWWSRR
ncbi:MAG: gliding motility-associatede transport system auxiliary component [Rhodospirillaceae bacterium]|nr:gliding motility-associatede transport system auxiliary component [Rhodospirillaceae bacterium]